MATTKRARTPEEKMALAEHIRELRKRIVIITGILLVSMIFGFVWYDLRIGVVPSLGEILRGPYCAIPASARLQLGESGECRLLATGPFEQFMLRMKVGAAAGAVVSSPLWLYQVWAFIAPGLYKKEKKATLSIVAIASLLFVCGAILAYFVVAKALDFLLTMGSNVQITALSGKQYFDFILALIVIFGLSFELPLAIVALNFTGVIKYEQLKQWRRLSILLLFCFAAVVTPGGDPVSMASLATTLVFLQEIAIQISRIHDRHAQRKRPDWLDGDDTTASALDDPTSPEEASDDIDLSPDKITASSIDTPEPIEPPDPNVPRFRMKELWGWADYDDDEEESTDHDASSPAH